MSSVKSYYQEGIDKGYEKGREEGREEGVAQAARRMLRRLAERRFGDLDDASVARIEAFDAATAERLVEQIFVAQSLAELLEDEPAEDSPTASSPSADSPVE